MKTLLNVIWLVLCGFWLFLGYALAGVICCILIVTIPWGIASFRIANYVLWPFGRQVVQKPTAGAFSFLGNVIWFIFAGLWLAIDRGMHMIVITRATPEQTWPVAKHNPAEENQIRLTRTQNAAAERHRDAYRTIRHGT